MVPRPHQSKAIDYALDRLKGPSSRCLAQLPTGSGKSLVKAHVALHWHNMGRRVVVLTPSASTVGKLYFEFKRLGLKPDVSMADERAHPQSSVVISTYATAWHEQRSKYFEPTSLLILDECHHCNDRAQSNLNIYRQYHYVFGVSASPWSKACLSLFEHHYVYSLRDAIKDTVNCDFQILPDAPIGSEPYQLVFCPTSATTRQLGHQFPNGDWVLYDADDKHGRVLRFKQGRIKTMFVKQMLTEGFDLPPIKNVWIQQGTKSAIMAYQMIGRALRPYEGKTARCYIRHSETRKAIAEALSLAGY